MFLTKKSNIYFHFFLYTLRYNFFLERLQLYRSSDLAGGGKDWSLKSFITCSCISSDTLLAIIARLPILWKIKINLVWFCAVVNPIWYWFSVQYSSLFWLLHPSFLCFGMKIVDNCDEFREFPHKKSKSNEEKSCRGCFCSDKICLRVPRTFCLNTSTHDFFRNAHF